MASRKADYSPEAWGRHKQREAERNRTHRERHREYVRRYVADRREWLDAYKREHGCTDCGTREGRLDFDHRPGETKRLNLGRPRASWATIHAEVAKCDVRCASCHTKRHHAASAPGMTAVPKLSSP